MQKLLIILIIKVMIFAVKCQLENVTNQLSICGEDHTMKDVRAQLEALKLVNENLGLKLDIYNMRLNPEMKCLYNKKEQHFSKLHFPDMDCRPQTTKMKYQKQLPKNCAEAMEYENSKSGIYKIYIPDSDLKPFYVYCLNDPNNGTAWTVIQRRQEGGIDFSKIRDWKTYQEGFGNLNGAFFIGLEKLNAITQSELHELWFDMEDFEGEKRYAKYDSFAIGDNSTYYDIKILGNYSGDAGDSFTYHEGMKFTTGDVDNDLLERNCADLFKGCWWYRDCHYSNLNGVYLGGKYEESKYGTGVIWHTWHGEYYSLKNVLMAIRPIT
ncbi:microfibril-associated glycoprotein 4-like [Teleopsis dalmanni]|uniref:microfibril-associated glycoprotein 4-like n=1 Tax=Teleopsis dalmanni TaxID=139649 RepID=UPI0018CEA401|nr:microfibril-associated glycoprotein 4-like [Teleopsis dalmanni]